MPGWKLDQATGTLTVSKLDRQDAGEYTCIAENKAGRIQSSAVLSVIIKPHIQELFNKTFPIGLEKASLTCKASGDPLPKIIWRKWSRKYVLLQMIFLLISIFQHSLLWWASAGQCEDHGGRDSDRVTG